MSRNSSTGLITQVLPQSHLYTPERGCSGMKQVVGAVGKQGSTGAGGAPVPLISKPVQNAPHSFAGLLGAHGRVLEAWGTGSFAGEHLCGVKLPGQNYHHLFFHPLCSLILRV